MFQRFYELSELLDVNRKKTWELLNEGMPENYDRGFAICFDQNGYTGIKTINGHKGISNEGVVYLSGSSNNSAPLSPCIRLSEKMDRKINFLFECTKDIEQDEDLPEDWKKWFMATDWNDKKLQKQIVSDIAEKVETERVGKEKLPSGKKRSGYAFPAYCKNGEIKPVYELEAAKRVMAEKAQDIWSQEGKRKGVCSVCGDMSEVFGNFARLKCYSLDKRGMIVGGHRKTLSHKNFPVCHECAFALSYTINYVQSKLTAAMAGQSYMILPFCSSADPDLKKLILKELEKQPNRFIISKNCDLIAGEEEEFVSYLQEENLRDQLAFSLIFFKENKKEWKIKAEVQQVLPGRMRILHDARRKIMEEEVLAAKVKDTSTPLAVTAYTFQLFSDAASTKISERNICHWFAAVFEGKTTDRKIFMRQIAYRLITVGHQEPKKLFYYSRNA